MLFVAVGNVRAGTAKERMARGLSWKYPPGMKPIAEYVTMSGHPSVISVAEADDIAPIMAAVADWDDVISWTVRPAMTAEQSMELAKRWCRVPSQPGWSEDGDPLGVSVFQGSAVAAKCVVIDGAWCDESRRHL